MTAKLMERFNLLKETVILQVIAGRQEYLMYDVFPA